MWIRNQGRTILMDCDSFAVEDHSGKYDVIILNCRTSISISLGMYSTKEKALKVLDEIQTCIMTEHQFCTEDVNCIGKYFTKEWKEIYQMPQDWEVEV